jgi:hypothetical protein
MLNNNSILFFCIFLLCCCNTESAKNKTCRDMYKTANKMVFTYPNPPASQATLDSAITLLNASMSCDSIKNAAIELKITVLTAMNKINEAMKFVDSLNESNFRYPYKKKLVYKSLQAFKDSSIKKEIYSEMRADLTKYLANHNIIGKEFEEVYTELSAIKEYLNDTANISKEIDSLIILHPDKERFLNFFKKSN